MTSFEGHSVANPVITISFVSGIGGEGLSFGFENITPMSTSDIISCGGWSGNRAGEVL